MFMEDVSFFAAFGLIMLITLVFGVIAYVISALAFCKVLRLMGHPKPVMGWVPIYGQICILDATKACGVVIFGRFIPMSTFRFLPLAPIVSCLMNMIPLLGAIAGMILSIAYLIGSYYMYKLVYGILDGKSDLSDFDIVALLSLFIPLITLFKFFLASEANVSFAGIQAYNASFGMSSDGSSSQTYDGTNPYYDNQGYNQGGQYQQPQGFQPYPQQQAFNSQQGYRGFDNNQNFGGQQSTQGFGVQQSQAYPGQQQGFQPQGFQPQQQAPQQPQQSSNDDDFTFI